MSLQQGDTCWVLRKSGYTTIGIFQWMDEQFICIVGTVGDDIGYDILIPIENVDFIRGDKRG